MAEMHARKDELPVEEVGPDYKSHMGRFGDYMAYFESAPAGFGGPDFFKGLPDDACQSPHWGYVFKGKFKATYTDGSEDIVSAGEAYYLPPGHVFEVLEPLETIEFSPRKEFEQTVEQVSKNIEAMGS